ncbi:MAG: diguanylate cyclase, partial [Bacillota bacterium]
LAKNAMNTAITAASFIEEDIEPYKNLSQITDYTDGNYDEAYYKKMLNLFNRLKNETGAAYIFTEKMISDRKIEYIIDGEDPDSSNFSPIGSKDSMGKLELRTFQEGKPFATNIINDEAWGEFLTGFAPITDKETQKVIGIVGVDFSLNYVESLIENIRTLIMFCFLLIMILSTIVMYIVLDLKYKASEIDYLTNLFSRGYHEQQLKWVMERSRWNNKPLSLAMIDIDDFKKINDEFGHITGDLILQSVGKILKKNSRHTDICSRYGGDEFILVLPGTNTEEAIQICERIRKIIEDKVFETSDGTPIRVTLSMGLNLWNEKISARELVKSTDQAMYRSKNSGKNKISIAGSSTQLENG